MSKRHAVLELLNHEEVQAIFGPQTETENTFAAELAEKVHVPVISFTAKSSTLSTDNHYFVRTTPDDALRAQALAAICQGFEWHEVVVLYEDTDHGDQFLSYLHKAFQEVEVGVANTISLHIYDNDMYLLEELKRLKVKQTSVFLVHMNPLLGYRLFTLAKRVGLMSEGYAWIISDSLSNFVNSMDSVTRNSMQGTLGIRSYVHLSEELKKFQERWKMNMFMENTTSPAMELNVYGLWAYDAVTALAIAVEKIGPVNFSSFHANTAKSLSENTNLRISTLGPQLLYELSRTQIRGLTGNFQLMVGKLGQSTFEIFNVYGSGEKNVGFWTPDRGITRELSTTGERTHSISSKELKSSIWPGDSSTRPSGWAIPAKENLRVGILLKKGFKDFVDVKFDPATNRTKETGFAIDIFLATLKLLPFPVDYELRLYNGTNNSDWSYDDMLHEIPKKFDMVVGATTIWAPRAAYVDFSLPYSESGAVLMVRNKKPFDMWIFTKPLSWDLWLAIFVAFILMVIALSKLEHKVTRSDEDPNKAQRQISGVVNCTPALSLAFAERNMVSNKWSIVVLLFWLFKGFILMQCYCANLSAILTVDQLNFAFSDKYYVGYQEGSFIKQFLTEHLHISEARLRSYSSPEEYHHAMTLGSKKGGIDAIFDEIPYMKILLKKYDSEYKMVGQPYRTGGFGFAFPIGSPLVSHFSKAILDVTQGPDMTVIEQKNFGPGYSSQDPLSSTISQGTSSLTFLDFAGLFLIIGSVTIVALICSETKFGRNLIEKLKTFIPIDFHFKTSNANDSVVGGSAKGVEDRKNEPNNTSVAQNTPSVPPNGQVVEGLRDETLQNNAGVPPREAPKHNEGEIIDDEDKRDETAAPGVEIFINEQKNP